MSQYCLGFIYSQGICGVARDDAKAREWFARAAAGGYADAALSTRVPSSLRTPLARLAPLCRVFDAARAPRSPYAAPSTNPASPR
jgi:TPR repeat protein